MDHPAGTAAFWRSRWVSKQTGFHEGKPNRHLTRFWPEMQGSPGGRVLVPLCGASTDLLWLLAAGHSVVGVELAPEAIERFFSDNTIPAERRKVGPHEAWTAGGLTLICANILEVSATDLGVFDRLYDRAALIALPPAMRSGYVATIRSLLAPGANGLLVSFGYDQSKRDGPPFSVPASEVEALWPGAALLGRERLDEEPWKAFDVNEAVWFVQP